MLIFIAESQLHVSRALRLVLEQQGAYEIAGEARHPESLLAQVCTKPPDLILLDWNLPGLRPHYLLNTLKRFCPNTLVLATSVNPENQQPARASGADGFILKTTPPDEFLRAVSDVLEASALKDDVEGRT
jgi:SARP family transcriptional regulator, regulator of embCAB operon